MTHSPEMLAKQVFESFMTMIKTLQNKEIRASEVCYETYAPRFIQSAPFPDDGDLSSEVLRLFNINLLASFILDDSAETDESWDEVERYLNVSLSQRVGFVQSTSFFLPRKASDSRRTFCTL